MRNLELFAAGRDSAPRRLPARHARPHVTSMGARLLRRRLGPAADRHRRDRTPPRRRGLLPRERAAAGAADELLHDMPDVERAHRPHRRRLGASARPRWRCGAGWSWCRSCGWRSRAARARTPSSRRRETVRAKRRARSTSVSPRSRSDCGPATTSSPPSRRRSTTSRAPRSRPATSCAPGFSQELDALRLISRDVRRFLAELEAGERERTGIRSLKVGYNRVFGYYIEISKGERRGRAGALRAPPVARQRRALRDAAAARVREPDPAREGARRRSWRRRSSGQVCAQVAAAAAQCSPTAGAVAELDVACALAEAAARYRLRAPGAEGKPTASRSATGATRWSSARSRPAPSCRTTPTLSSCDEQIVVLTGPEHGRQVAPTCGRSALIVLMAQCGAFVPASSACDRRRRPRVHARRRRRRPDVGPVDVHGGDDRDQRHPPQRDEPLAADSRRDRPRHQHLRRHGDRAVGGRVPAQPPRPAGRRRSSPRTTTSWWTWRSICRASATTTSPSPKRAGASSSCAASCRAAPTAATACTSPSWPACRRPSCAGRRRCCWSWRTALARRGAHGRRSGPQLSLFASTPPDDGLRRELAELDVDALSPLEAMTRLYELRERARTNGGGGA